MDEEVITDTKPFIRQLYRETKGTVDPEQCGCRDSSCKLAGLACDARFRPWQAQQAALRGCSCGRLLLAVHCPAALQLEKLLRPAPALALLQRRRRLMSQGRCWRRRPLTAKS